MSHVIVVDLGFGDAGKGTVVDWLCTQGRFAAVVRFNGGAQAAHNVVTPDGRHHTFAQFGSGTFTPGVLTHLACSMLVDPLALASEAAHLASLGVPDALDRLTIDGDALLTTPYHRAANRLREGQRGTARHGSCGMGIGETAAYALSQPSLAPRVADCRSPRVLDRKLTTLYDWLRDTFPTTRPSTAVDALVPPVADCADAFTAFADRVRIVGGDHLTHLLRTSDVVFEGAQGVLLDEWRGFHPYTTWSTTTFANAAALLATATGNALRLGVIRSYMTRHGPGPFVTEDPALTADLPDPHNHQGPWQGAFRVGHLDLVALRYALEVTHGADALAVTHLDVAQQRSDLLACHAYDLDGNTIDRLALGTPRDLTHQSALTARLLTARPHYAPLSDPMSTAEHGLGVPVALRSYGPTSTDKHATPAWV